jgi:hypothetical protein
MKKKEMDALLFIDTNILLDFYRNRTSNICMQFLEQIEACKERLILTSQLEMEYKKNRQKVIIETLKNFGTPDWNKLTVPALVSELQATEMIKKEKEKITEQQKKVTKKIHNILESPGRHDDVYKVLQRIFKHKSAYNLNREDERRFAIRRLARKRFLLGYPPRKDKDTSYSDAINWEWTVQCAIDSGKDVVIVSRDGDYGINYRDVASLNDWLIQEFKQRAGRKKILLTESLAEGLKIVHAKVTEEMEHEEQLLMHELRKFMENVDFEDDDSIKCLHDKSDYSN